MRSYTQVWGLGLRLILGAGGEWSTIQPTTPTNYLLANLHLFPRESDLCHYWFTYDSAFQTYSHRAPGFHG